MKEREREIRFDRDKVGWAALAVSFVSSYGLPVVVILLGALIQWASGVSNDEILSASGTQFAVVAVFFAGTVGLVIALPVSFVGTYAAVHWMEANARTSFLDAFIVGGVIAAIMAIALTMLTWIVGSDRLSLIVSLREDAQFLAFFSVVGAVLGLLARLMMGRPKLVPN